MTYPTDFRALCDCLIEVVRMPNIEHVADDHNAAVRELKRLSRTSRHYHQTEDPPMIAIPATMEQPSFRALCAEFVAKHEELSRALGKVQDWDSTRVGDALDALEAVIEQASAALSAAPQQGATSDEAWQEFIEQLQQVQHVALSEGQGPRFDLVEFALAAWRYSGQAAPVPVAERSPGADECDDEGRCWFLTWDGSWMLEDRTYGCNSGRTHWLPWWALPLPEATQ